MKESDVNQFESLFASIDAKIGHIKSSYPVQINELEARIEKYFQDEEKIRNETTESCLELITRLKNSLELSIRPENLNHQTPVEFKKGKQSLFSLFTSRLHHSRPFDSAEKIKYVNLLRVFEYNEDNFGLDDLNGPYYNDYDILNVVLISINRVFLYLTCTHIEKPDLMIIRHVKIKNVKDPNLIANSNPVLCERETPKRDLFAPNMLAFEDKIVILYRNVDQKTYTVELLSSTRLETIKTIPIEYESKYETFDAFLMNNYQEIIVDLQHVHLIYDSSLSLVARLGQNKAFNEPFYNGDGELLYISCDMLFYRVNVLQRLKLKILSRSGGQVLYSFMLPFVREFNRLDSILVAENERKFVYKSFTTNNIFSFDFGGDSILLNTIKSNELTARNLYFNYRTYLRDRKYLGLEKSYLFYQYNSKFKLKKILLI